MNTRRSQWLATLVAVVFAFPALAPERGEAQTGSRTFPETGHTVSGRFLEYWNTHGGLAQQGYPISEEMQERSGTDGKTYTVHYCERSVFEYHPDNPAPDDVLLALLGTFQYRQRYNGSAPGQVPNRS